jgi:hypothetical protein
MKVGREKGREEKREKGRKKGEEEGRKKAPLSRMRSREAEEGSSSPSL